MRFLRRVLVGLVLVASAGLANAATYTWTVLGVTFVTTEPTCAALAVPLMAYMNSPQNAVIGTPGTTYYWTGDCTAATRNAGDYTLLGFQFVNGTTSYSGTLGAVLTSIKEDDDADDVSGMPMQRVAVMLGCMLIFGVGWIAGK